ncbi:MAG: hypothetical protein AAGN82_02070 [Myxococcota bacterium]
MMIVEEDQVRALAWAGWETKRRELAARFTREHPDLADEADRVMRFACDIADDIHFENADDIYALMELSLLPGWPEVPGRWGRLLPHVLANRDATPAARLELLRREVLPRVHEELRTLVSPISRRPQG